MRIAAIIQARLGSTRLPGKVMLPLAGEAALTRVYQRVARAPSLTAIVIATTTNPADDILADFCAAQGWSCFRGSETDVLDRYYQAAKIHQADVVIRITSDCPLIDPAIIERVIAESSALDADYASVDLPPLTFPTGMDAEFICMDALERAWRDCDNPNWREHVTPYLYHHPELFQLHRVAAEADYSAMRWTLDTPDDLAFLRRIYDHFGGDEFSWRDVLKLLDAHPEWLTINRDVKPKPL